MKIRRDCIDFKQRFTVSTPKPKRIAIVDGEMGYVARATAPRTERIVPESSVLQSPASSRRVVM